MKMNHYWNVHPIQNMIIKKQAKPINLTVVIIDWTSSLRRVETIGFDIAVTND
jgi:hypothetical protein